MWSLDILIYFLVYFVFINILMDFRVKIKSKLGYLIAKVEN
jgi:hypothetical protein